MIFNSKRTDHRFLLPLAAKFYRKGLAAVTRTTISICFLLVLGVHLSDHYNNRQTKGVPGLVEILLYSVTNDSSSDRFLRVSRPVLFFK